VLQSILLKVERLDQLNDECEHLRADLAAARSQIGELESRTIRYVFLQDEHDKQAAELRQARAQLSLAEDEVRLAKPMRDALVRQLQVRALCSRSHPGRCPWLHTATACAFTRRSHAAARQLRPPGGAAGARAPAPA
jgi:hypothetical protein